MGVNLLSEMRKHYAQDENVYSRYFEVIRMTKQISARFMYDLIKQSRKREEKKIMTVSHELC